MSNERGNIDDSAMQRFYNDILQLQTRLEKYAEEKKDQHPDQEPSTAILLEELNLLMEEMHVAAEELQAQNRELGQARDELETERQKYEDLFFFAPDAYLVTDRRGVILEANQEAGYLFNIQPQYLIQKPLAQYVQKDEHREFRNRLNQLANTEIGGRIQHWEFQVMPRSGRFVEVSASVTPILTNKSYAEKEITYRWLVRDIRSQKRLQEDMREMKNELLKSRERERQKLARSLHDGPVQDLHGVIFLLKPMENELDQPRLRNSVEQVESQLVDVVRKLRQMCSELRPPALIPFGLEKAIRSHAGMFRESNPEIGLNLDLTDINTDLTEEERLVLFQVYRQAMANVFRHAKAKQVWVRLSAADKNINMEIEDNGMGFVVPNSWVEMVRHQHYGLADATERAESIGGNMEVQSEPGRGTRVRVTLPQNLSKVQEEITDGAE